jgi:hypothetical protein
MSNVKNYCYRDECTIVHTGFNTLALYSCKVCKEECTERLKDQKESSREDKIPSWGTDLDNYD